MPRRLGQHFLFDPNILERIAYAASPQTEPLVIEIGAGPGGLTGQLAARAGRVIAVELDAALASALRGRWANVEVVEGDVLKTGLDRWGPAVVAGNLPYYITGPIVELTLGLGPLLKRAVFLVQREVAERLAAAPGSRDFGYLSVAVQARCRVERLFAVKPGAFKPPPKVESAVVRLTPRTPPAVEDMAGFLRFAAMCFGRKRKTLRNNLAGSYPREWVESLPEAGLRAEQLGVERLAALWRTRGHA